jgi:hypothetical protein
MELESNDDGMIFSSDLDPIADMSFDEEKIIEQRTKSVSKLVEYFESQQCKLSISIF